MSHPKQINIYNMNMFFDFKGISTSQIIPGNIIQFNYRSPDGVHDKKPLIYVLETQSDRVYGLNLHYEFKLMQDVIAKKDIDLIPYKPSGNVEALPGVTPEVKKVPIILLEKYNLVRQPTFILRNYLYPRMSGVTKLIYKPDF